MNTKVLLDTDIGSDIDDAVSLAYLLAHPRCDLLGITTVTGEADKRAMLASALCKVAGVEVPIFPGKETPLLVSQQQVHAPQAETLGNWDHDKDFPRGRAVDFLGQTIRQNPGEVVLLTIGPLTNIGTLFRQDPEVPSLLKAMVTMCGWFTDRYGKRTAEWNAGGDPHATGIVFESRVRTHRLLGLDVTSQVKMDSDGVRERFRSDLLEPVLDFAGVWFKENDVITFHDPLAAAAIFNEGICVFEKGTAGVELENEKQRGMTYWRPGGPDPCHEVALEVDPDRFFQHFFSVFD